MTCPFDRSLEAQELMLAAEEYALQRGPPDTLAYRAAWLEFRQRVRTIGDVRPGRHEPSVVNGDTVSVLSAAIERAMVIDGAPMANAQFFNPRDRTLRIVAHSGFSTEFLRFFDVVDDASCACGTALATGHAVWVPDTTRSSVFADTPALDVMLDARSRAVASVPVLSPNGRLIGMISTHHARATRWTDQRKLGLQVVARSAGRLLDHLTPTAPAGRRD